MLLAGGYLISKGIKVEGAAFLYLPELRSYLDRPDTSGPKTEAKEN